ncbi:MAG: hypothetical protein AAF745_05605 [Planctomycetota bacterium]
MSGCNSQPELAKVTGSVLVDGQPLDQVKVSFVPDVGKGTEGYSSSAYTDETGAFELSYGRLADRPGAVVGWHRVAVQDVKSENFRGEGSPPAIRVPSNIRKSGSTPIRLEIVAGEQTVDIDLADYGVKLPRKR